ncbi:MAG: hypothetical protein BMS9Abin33_0307 [Gammaproteobacteria bacterium]|nr:MAG: hypothetical protein BMS9Abin33_0307 [Gammaproteobacteria bacterium]
MSVKSARYCSLTNGIPKNGSDGTRLAFSIPTPALHLANQVDKPALAVVIEIGEVVGEVGEVVTGAEFHVLVHLAIQSHQAAAAAVTDIGLLQGTAFD